MTFQSKSKLVIIVSLAFVIGLISILPDILFINREKSTYQGIPLAGTESEYFYVSRVQEVYDGHFRLASVDMLEYKDRPFVQPPLGEIIIAGFGQVFNLSAVEAVAWGKGVFIVILFFAIFSVTWLLTKNYFTALTVPIVILLGSNLVWQPKELVTLFKGELNRRSFIAYNRPVHPLISSLLFWSWLYSLCYLYLSGNKLKDKDKYFKLAITLFVSVLLLSVLFYTYLYAWTYALVLIILLIIVRFWQRDWPQVKQLSLITVTGLVLVLPYFFNLWQAQKFSEDFDLLSKIFGVYQGRFYTFSLLLAITLISLSSYLIIFKNKFEWGKETIDRYILFFSFIATGFIVINQQLLTGIVLQPGHWHWYYITPLSVMIIIYLLFEFTSKMIRRKTNLFLYLTTTVIILIVVVNALTLQFRSYQHIKDDFLKLQRLAPVFSWLQRQTPRDSVVLANRPIRPILTAFTHNNLYYNFDYNFYLVPLIRLRHNYFLHLWLQGVKPAESYSYILSHKSDLLNILGGGFYARSIGCYQCFDIEDLKSLSFSYQQFNQSSIWSNLRKYKIDYLVYDTLSGDNWPAELFEGDNLRLLTEINGVKIFQTIPD